MSYDLTNRDSVTFNVLTGAKVEFDVGNATCVLDIHSNLFIDMAKHGLHQKSGNYSRWVSLNDNEGVAVTGLTSCGAVFIANREFSRIAAGHMSGDAFLAQEWLDALLKDASIKPWFMVWGTGPTGSRRTGGTVLRQYMKALDISSMARAPAVAGCGAVFLVKSAIPIVHATRDVWINVKRSGQAVKKEYKVSTELERAVAKFNNSVKLYDGSDTTSQFLLLQSLLSIMRNQTVGIIIEESKQKEFILQNGDVLKQYYQTLPPGLKTAFLKFAIFEAYPDFAAAIR